MSTGESDSDARNECILASEAAESVVLEHCLSEDDIKRALARRLGVDPDVDCQPALDDGPTARICSDSRRLREWVLCRATQLVHEEEYTFTEAQEAAWAAATDACDSEGVAV